MNWISWAGKMELSCPLGMQALSHMENLSCFGVLSHIMNPILTKLVLSRWLDIGLIVFLHVHGPRLSVHKHVKKELGQYTAILTSCLVNNPSIVIVNNPYIWLAKCLDIILSDSDHEWWCQVHDCFVLLAVSEEVKAWLPYFSFNV